MPEKSPIEKAVIAAYENSREIHFHHSSIDVEYDVTKKALILEGEVSDIIAKKRAFEIASRMDDVEGVIDNLRIVQKEPIGDGAIRVSLTNALLTEQSMRDCEITALNKGASETLRHAFEQDGCRIMLNVHGGIIWLNGKVTSLTLKRLAGVISWWTPGCRDVINEMDVVPKEDDSDDEIADAVRIVLEKDPLVHAGQIGAHVRRRVVTLEGSVASLLEKRFAELDVWYISGVTGVVNHIVVHR